MQVVEEIQNLVPAVDPGGEGQGEGYRSAGEVFKPLFAVGKNPGHLWSSASVGRCGFR